MFEKIEKLKQGKIDPNELLKSLSMDTTQKVSITKSDKVQIKPIGENKESRK